MSNKIGFLVKKEDAIKIVKAMYEGEPCRVCGETITDISKAVYAGYSADNKSRCAHKSCWDRNTPKPQWAYPQDA